MTVERDFGERGLEKGLARLRCELGAGALKEASWTLADVLQGCYALQEYHVNQFAVANNLVITSKGKKVSKGQKIEKWHNEHRLGKPGGEAQAALAWARRYSGHELWDFASIVNEPKGMTTRHAPDGGSVTLARPLINEMRWKKLLDLPPTKVDPDGRDAYDTHVAGREPLQPLEAAQRFLTGLPKSY